MDVKTNAKIRVRLESFNPELLVSSCQKITDILSNTALSSIGMVHYQPQKEFIVS